MRRRFAALRPQTSDLAPAKRGKLTTEPHIAVATKLGQNRQIHIQALWNRPASPAHIVSSAASLQRSQSLLPDSTKTYASIGPQYPSDEVLFPSVNISCMFLSSVEASLSYASSGLAPGPIQPLPQSTLGSSPSFHLLCIFPCPSGKLIVFIGLGGGGEARRIEKVQNPSSTRSSPDLLFDLPLFCKRCASYCTVCSECWPPRVLMCLRADSPSSPAGSCKSVRPPSGHPTDLQ
jgi:hypothetical protein